MQTVTHLAVGAAIGAVYFPHDHLAQVACVTASIWPDLVMMPLYALDTLRGRRPLAKQGRTLLFLKELSHSVFLSAAVLIAGIVVDRSLVLAFGIGWIVHVVIDVLTHGDPKFQAYGDPNYIWPLGSLRQWAIWEYRIETGQLWPLKPLELFVLIGSSGIALLGWIVR